MVELFASETLSTYDDMPLVVLSNRERPVPRPRVFCREILASRSFSFSPPIPRIGSVAIGSYCLGFCAAVWGSAIAISRSFSSSDELDIVCYAITTELGKDLSMKGCRASEYIEKDRGEWNRIGLGMLRKILCE